MACFEADWKRLMLKSAFVRLLHAICDEDSSGDVFQIANEVAEIKEACRRRYCVTLTLFRKYSFEGLDVPLKGWMSVCRDADIIDSKSKFSRSKDMSAVFVRANEEESVNAKKTELPEWLEVSKTEAGDENITNNDKEVSPTKITQAANVSSDVATPPILPTFSVLCL